MLDDLGSAVVRSYLYVPADRQDRLGKATTRHADALILDLEDAVPPARKDAARRELARWLAEQGDTGCQLWVRINPGQVDADIAATVTAHVTGVVVPKAEPSLLAEIHELLGQQEHAINVPAGRIGVLPIIETARGLHSATEVATAPRVARLGIGEADLAADLRLRPSPGRGEFLPLLLQIVVASAAARVGPPVGPASTDFHDLAALRESTEALFRLGFRARTAIHPAQIPTINTVFTPSAADVARARDLVTAFEDAERRGVGVITDGDGRMVDVAVVRSAREVLARAGRGPAAP